MDIDKLEVGPETDALMAERVMGWHKFNEDGIPCWCFTRTKATHPDQTDVWLARFPHQATGWTFADLHPEGAPWGYQGIAWKGIWRPSQDIAPAWEVVEKLTDKGQCPGLIFDDNGHWALSLEGAQNVPIGPDPQDIATSFFLSADMWCETVPLTICRAALKAVNAE